MNEFEGGVVIVSHDARLLMMTNCEMWLIHNQAKEGKEKEEKKKRRKRSTDRRRREKRQRRRNVDIVTHIRRRRRRRSIILRRVNKETVFNKHIQITL